MSNPTKNKRAVGVIGLGTMGMGAAQSLLRAGFEVHGCDLRPPILQALVDAGGVACASPREMGAKCDVVITLVVNAEQTDTVLFGADGAFETMKPNSVVIASATAAPEYAQTLAKRLAEKNILLLDAPVSGGGAKAAAGQMTMMTAGPPEVYAKIEDVLAGMAGKVYRLGAAHGLGSKMKIVNQLLAGVHIAAAAEAMALGMREGVDPEALFEVITHSAGNSWMFENRVPHILKGDYTPLSAVDIFVKDLGLVLDTARKSKFPLPLSAAAHQMYMMASTAGHGREDDAAVIKIFPGIDLPGNKKAER